MDEFKTQQEAGVAPRWIEGEAFDEFWAGLWRSRKGRAWAASGSGLALWLQERLAARPFFLCQPWEPELQRRHFAQMWGQVFARTYANDALSDLFWIHELSHWASVDFAPSEDFASWWAKWDLNELRASVASEMLIHGEVDSWDQDALGKDVWARSFGAIGGSNPEDDSTWTEASRSAAARRVAIRDGLVQPAGEDEAWFASFGPANAYWAHLWRDGAWRQVDQGLALYGQALRAGDRAGAKAALERAGQVAAYPAVPYLAQAEGMRGR